MKDSTWNKGWPDGAKVIQEVRKLKVVRSRADSRYTVLQVIQGERVFN